MKTKSNITVSKSNNEWRDDIEKNLDSRLDFLIDCNPANEDLKPEIVIDIRNLFKIALQQQMEVNLKEFKTIILETIPIWETVNGFDRRIEYRDILLDKLQSLKNK